MKLNPNETKLAYFYTFLLMVLFSVPVYFTLSFAIEKEFLEKQIFLERYMNKIEKNTDQLQKIEEKSVQVKVLLVDNQGNDIISYLSSNLTNRDFKFHHTFTHLYYKKDVAHLNGDLAYIIAEVEMNYSKVIFLAVLLFYIILMNIYLLNKSIIKNISKPYELMQKYTTVLFNNTMHELKTPIGIVNLNLDLHERKNGSNKYTSRMKTALKQIQVNYEAIEYYIKNQRIQYPKEKINFSQFLHSRIEFFEDMATAKQMTFELNIEEDISIFMNPLELQRIIDNTIINAIKYSKPKKSIEIYLKKGKRYSVLSIKDYGFGIKNPKNVFQRFSREDTTQGGFGLGLNIIQTICNKNDIKIALDSKEDVGSTFKYKIELYREKLLDRLENV